MPKRVALFIDGFNYYYGMFQSDPIKCHPRDKWLDPVALGNRICAHYAIGGSIEYVHYCSAKVLPSHNDPDQPTRQDHYFRALRGIPNVIVSLGQHRESVKWAKHENGNGPVFRVRVREEKGTDVNLAVHLVADAALQKYDTAIVISNDSDLESAVRIAKDTFKREVIVVSPKFNAKEMVGKDGRLTQRRPRVVHQLKQAATRSFVIDHTLLSSCRLPDPAPSDDGSMVDCPKSWN